MRVAPSISAHSPGSQRSSRCRSARHARQVALARPDAQRQPVTLIALKVDVDTYRGTHEGAVRLAQLLERLSVPATFLFSLGPDHTGRAIRRAFRRGFLGKVKRTSVLEHYGLKTLLYGVLLPGPHIGRGCRREMQEIARRGFEVGVHTWDHVRWQDGVARASEAWTRQELTLARDEFAQVFGRAPVVHGAAGWQMNRHVPALQEELGFRYASDTRGTGPFVPLLETGSVAVPQLPTTLPHSMSSSDARISGVSTRSIICWR